MTNSENIINKKVLVCGASGFIGHHLVRFLKSKGYYVRGVDIVPNPYHDCDEFLQYDLTKYRKCAKAVYGMDEVYQLAAKMGGMGFISSDHLSSFHDSNLINTYMAKAASEYGVKRLFFSSSACVYPTFKQNTLEVNVMHEEDAIPAQPNEAYGWEKLVSEFRYQEYARKYPIEVRIARFENTYGPEGTYEGGREKAPAALCRKVALARDGDEIEVWGDGLQTRSFMYINDCVEGIYAIMQGDYSEPVNLGNENVVQVNELAELIIKISGKNLKVKNVDGPQGVRSRYVSHTLAKQLYNWSANVSLEEGLEKTYDWINEQVNHV